MCTCQPGFLGITCDNDLANSDLQNSTDPLSINPDDLSIPNFEIQHDSGGENLLLSPNHPITTCNPNPCQNEGNCKIYYSKSGLEVPYCESDEDFPLEIPSLEGASVADPRGPMGTFRLKFFSELKR